MSFEEQQETHGAIRYPPSEGMNWVKITLHDETVRAEAGALSYMMGEIKMDSPLPSLPGIIKSALADESILRPRYSGTGEIHLGVIARRVPHHRSEG